MTLWLGKVIFLLTLSCAPIGVAQSAGATASTIISGEIQIPEVSGATFLPGDRLLVVSDEGQTVFLLEHAAQHLMTGKVAKSDFQAIALKGRLNGAGDKARELDDLEDVAWDRQSSLLLVTSHSRNRTGKGLEKRPERYGIARLTLGAEVVAAGTVPVFDLEGPSALQEAMKRTPAQSGFNIEGAAWSREGHLLLGLRSPTETFGDSRKPDSNEDAILLEVKDPSTNPLVAEIKARLNLKGSGIRGMLYDPDEHGLWILAGLSPDLQDDMVEAKWALWFLRDDGTLASRELPKEAELLTNAEAVARVSIGDTKQPHLLLVEDGLAVSHYVLFPLPKQ